MLKDSPKKPKQDEPLYVDQWDLRQLSGNSIRLLLKRLGIKVGIENVLPHRFRHTFVIQFLRNGEEIWTYFFNIEGDYVIMVGEYTSLY